MSKSALVDSGLDEKFQAALTRLPGASHQAVRDLRCKAAQLFIQLGLPSNRQETWKYTDLDRLSSALGEHWFEIASLAGDVDINDAMIPDLEAWRIIFIDGVFHADQSLLPDNIRIQLLSTLLNDAPERATTMLAVNEDVPLFHSLMALNTAMASDGICINIPDRVCLDKPLYVLHYNTEHAQTRYNRHQIVLGQAAEATVIEHFSGSPDAAGLHHNMMHIHLNQGAHLEHYHLQTAPARLFHIGHTQMVQKRDSHVTSHTIALGAALSRINLIHAMDESGAECVLNGLYMIKGRQHVDIHTQIDHLAGQCRSREYYRGVVGGRARGVFNGMVVVHPNASGTDSEQSNSNLLLSDHAEVNTKPELEIYNDDVKCAHGATVGQVDEEQLFYLRSRGLSIEAARHALTRAFATDVLGRMQIVPVRNMIEQMMAHQLS